MKPEPRLIDACPAYARWLRESERAAAMGDLEGAESYWLLAVFAAHEYRKSLAQKPEESLS